MEARRCTGIHPDLNICCQALKPWPLEPPIGGHLRMIDAESFYRHIQGKHCHFNPNMDWSQSPLGVAGIETFFGSPECVLAHAHLDDEYFDIDAVSVAFETARVEIVAEAYFALGDIASYVNLIECNAIARAHILSLSIGVCRAPERLEIAQHLARIAAAKEEAELCIDQLMSETLI